MRIESPKRLKNDGWLHPLNSEPKNLPPKPAPVPVINSTKILKDWAERTKREWVDALALKIGVSSLALSHLGVAWAPPHRAWAFPMKDGYGETIGIRLRADNGSKWAVPGSHAGIFFPTCNSQTTGFVCEGPTDCAAALTLGLYAVGRPSCSGGVPLVITAFKRMGVTRAVIVGDNDKLGKNGEDPGLRGAETLARHFNIPTCVFIPPAKDLREMIQIGGTKQLIDVMIDNLIWKQPETNESLHQH